MTGAVKSAASVFCLILVISAYAVRADVEAKDTNGVFGLWELDSAGLPCYRYTMDEYADPAALYDTSLGKSSDHWHLVGNDRVISLAYNHGQIMLYSGERGAKWLNAPDKKGLRKSGGYGFLLDGSTILSTLYEDKPEDAMFERIFGAGYYRKILDTRDITLDQVVFAPFGSDPCWISRVTVSNKTDESKSLEWYEYWDVNLKEFGHMVEIANGGEGESSGEFYEKMVAWFFKKMGDNDGPGIISKTAYNFIDGYMRNATRDFLVSTERQGDILFASYRDPKAPVGPNDRSEIDHFPTPFFLAPLDQPLSDFETSRKTFFDKKGRPTLKCNSGLFRDKKAGKADICLVVKRSIELEPGQSGTVRFIIGYAEPNEAQRLLEKYRVDENAFSSMQKAWNRVLPELDIKPEWLSREMRWHAYYLRALASYDEYFKSFIISQGCAYQYLLGMNIAGRDPLQHMLPMIYLEPALAKEVLRYTLSSMDAKGFITYGIKGVGVRTGGANPFPSDINLYLMLALSEYVLATRDFSFLEEELPYYPIEDGKTGTVLEHMEFAFRHQIEGVGTGVHGLIKARNSDWNDAFIVEEKGRNPGIDPVLIENESESVLNTAMASYMLPYFAETLKAAGEKEFAAAVDKQAVLFREALDAQWNGRWYNRGWVAGQRRAGGPEQLYLSPQPWTIVGRNLDPVRELALTETLWSELSSRSPIGAAMRWPTHSEERHDEGEATFGGIWYSLNMPLIWAYSMVKPDYAWHEFIRSTLGTHAAAYPELWVGIWSGPDSYNNPYTNRPGMSWDSFPLLGGMIDFPIMCSHAHACPWFSFIKLAGIQPCGEGYVIDPKIQETDFKVSTALFALEKKKRSVSGKLLPLDSGPITFRVRMNNGTVKSKGKVIPSKRDGDFVVFTLTGGPQKPVEWIVSR